MTGLFIVFGFLFLSLLTLTLGRLERKNDTLSRAWKELLDFLRERQQHRQQIELLDAETRKLDAARALAEAREVNRQLARELDSPRLARASENAASEPATLPALTPQLESPR